MVHLQRLQDINGVAKSIENLRSGAGKHVEPARACRPRCRGTAQCWACAAQGRNVTTAQLCRLLFEHQKRAGVTFPKMLPNQKHMSPHMVVCIVYSRSVVLSLTGDALLLFAFCYGGVCATLDLGRVPQASEVGIREDMR